MLAWPQNCLITTYFLEDLDLGETCLPSLSSAPLTLPGHWELGSGRWGPCFAGRGILQLPAHHPSGSGTNWFLSNLILTGTNCSRQKSLAVCSKQVHSVDNQDIQTKEASELSVKLRCSLKCYSPNYYIYLPCSPEQLSGHLAPIQPKAPVFLLQTGSS